MLATTLLTMSDDPRRQATFAFDHDMQHRFYLRSMPIGSKIYQFDPTYDLNEPAGSWHFDHQQAHNDFNAAFHIPSPNSIVRETDLSNPRNKTWWTFINHQEHYAANLKLG